MKKIFSSLFVLVAIVAATSSVQAQSFGQGQIVINAGIGLQSFGTPIIANAEYGVTDQIGVGAGLQYVSYLGSSATAITAKGAYHFGELINVDKLDLYGGAEVLFSLATGGGTGFSLLPGARYYFSDNVGAFSELAIGLTNGGGTQFRLGVAFKLGGK